jgi:GDP-L-fucose synthase
MTALRGKRTTVSGGAGFLGSYVVDRLREPGAEVVVPRSHDYDLVSGDAVPRLYRRTAADQNAELQEFPRLCARFGLGLRG